MDLIGVLETVVLHQNRNSDAMHLRDATECVILLNNVALLGRFRCEGRRGGNTQQQQPYQESTKPYGTMIGHLYR